MLGLWAVIRQRDVEGYAATLLLPPHLSHLRLQTFSFAAQAPSCTGREPIVLTYVAEGRLEEVPLAAEEHALALIRAVCPQIDAARIQIAADDECWHWDGADAMRVYFAPRGPVLDQPAPAAVPDGAYVSVSRGHVWVGKNTVAAYLCAWLAHLGIDAASSGCTLAMSPAGIEFTAGAVGGQLLLDDLAATTGLIRFAGLEPILAQLRDLTMLDAEAGGLDDCEIDPDGVRIRLGVRSQESGVRS